MFICLGQFQLACFAAVSSFGVGHYHFSHFCVAVLGHGSDLEIIQFLVLFHIWLHYVFVDVIEFM